MAMGRGHNRHSAHLCRVTVASTLAVVNMTKQFDAKLTLLLAKIEAEFQRAIKYYRPMNSYHEGYAVLKEEMEELWDEIKRKPTTRSKRRLQEEAVQIGAMALRFLYDLCEE